MARKKKSSKNEDVLPEDIETENSAERAEKEIDEVAESTSSPDDVKDNATPENEAAETPTDLGNEDKEDIEAEVLSSDPVDEHSEIEDSLGEETTPESEHASENDVGPGMDDATPVAETPTLVTTEQVVIRKGGFAPMLLGGLAAGAIGFGVAEFGLKQGDTNDEAIASILSQLEDQTKSMDDLNTRIGELSVPTDLSDLITTQADQAAAISGLADRLSGLEAQFSDIQTLQSGEGVSDADLAAYDAALKSLQTSIEEQQAVIDAMSENAAQLEKNAQAAANSTLQRAALTRIQSALDAGTGFSPALADLENTGADIPSALHEISEDGVLSLPELLDLLPDAARSALEVSRKEAGTSGETGGFSSFLRSQLGARSLKPRDGSDPDAVLSRVEAAAREGRLNDALAEIEALPEAGRAELSYWSGQVAQRMAAVSAVQEMSDKLN